MVSDVIGSDPNSKYSEELKYTSSKISESLREYSLEVGKDPDLSTKEKGLILSVVSSIDTGLTDGLKSEQRLRITKQQLPEVTSR